MWQNVKIPLKIPNEKLYEISSQEENEKIINKTTNVSIESLYPKLVKQVLYLRKKLKLVIKAYTAARKTEKTLTDKINFLSQEKGRLKDVLKTFKKESNHLQEKVQKLTKNMNQIVREGQGSQENKDNLQITVGEDPSAYKPKVYIDVIENIMGADGQEKDEYK